MEKNVSTGIIRWNLVELKWMANKAQSKNLNAKLWIADKDIANCIYTLLYCS